MKYKIIYQEDNKKKTIILNNTSYSELMNHKDYPSNIISIIPIKKRYRFFKKNILTIDEVVTLFNEINIMLRAELAFGEVIEILLKEYPKDTQVYELLSTVSITMKQGLPIYSAFEKYKNIVGKFVVSFIKLGEEKGNINKSIESICVVLKKEQHNKKLIRSKFSYPFLLIVTLMIALLIIFIFVIPKFEYMFNQLGASLPIITQILLDIKYFLFKYIVFIILVLIICVLILFIGISKSSKFKYNIDKILLLKIPFVSKLLLIQQKYRFFLVLKVLVTSQYKITQALSSSKLIISNSYFLEQVIKIESYLNQGKDISSAFALVGIFDGLIIRLLLAAEKSNNIINTIQNIETVYEKRLEDSILKFSSSVEPLIISIIGLTILFIMLAIFLPIWQMGTILG